MLFLISSDQFRSEPFELIITTVYGLITGCRFFIGLLNSEPFLLGNHDVVFILVNIPGALHFTTQGRGVCVFFFFRS